jgi:hypothetical protein
VRRTCSPRPRGCRSAQSSGRGSRELTAPRCSGPSSRSMAGSSAAYMSRAVSGSPACPATAARLRRMVSVFRSTGLDTRSRTASSAAYMSRAVGSPASAVNRAKLPRASGCSGPETR